MCTLMVLEKIETTIVKINRKGDGIMCHLTETAMVYV